MPSEGEATSISVFILCLKNVSSTPARGLANEREENRKTIRFRRLYGWVVVVGEGVVGENHTVEK